MANLLVVAVDTGNKNIKTPYRAVQFRAYLPRQHPARHQGGYPLL